MPELPKLPKPSKKLPDGPSREEWQAAIGHAAGWMKVAIALGVLAGLRSGEIRALQVGDVDLAHMQINVRRAFSAADVLTPKDDEERVVPIIPELEAILRPAVESRATDARVIVTSMGSTPGRQAMLTALNRVQDKHGLRRRSVHALRHGFCSELVRRGASLEAVRLLAGHADLKTTQRYVHATAGDLVEAMSKLRGNGEVTAKEKSR